MGRPRRLGLFVGAGITALTIAACGGGDKDSKVQIPETPTIPPAATEPSHLHGLLALANNGNDPTLLAFAFYGDLGFDNMLSFSVRNGDIIGYTQNTGVKALADYNVVLQVTRLNPNKDGFVTDEEMLRGMFPQAFEKPVKKVAFEGQGTTTDIITYNDK